VGGADIKKTTIDVMVAGRERKAEFVKVQTDMRGQWRIPGSDKILPGLLSEKEDMVDYVTDRK